MLTHSTSENFTSTLMITPIDLPSMAPLIDTHCHLNMLHTPVEEALQRAAQAGVESVITVGTNAQDHPLCLEYACLYAPRVFCILGIHPHEAKHYNKQTADYIVEHAAKGYMVGVGEIGLDYHYDHSPRDVQKRVFEAQMDLAVQLDLPVQIHTRDAEDDTLSVLQKYQGQVQGLLHCFTSRDFLALKALDLGFNVSFSGVVSFKNAKNLRTLLKSIPLERLHIETDAPFLTPEPFRGKKNEPHYVAKVCEHVALAKDVPPQIVAKHSYQNTRALFKKMQTYKPTRPH